MSRSQLFNVVLTTGELGFSHFKILYIDGGAKTGAGGVRYCSEKVLSPCHINILLWSRTAIARQSRELGDFHKFGEKVLK